MSLGILIESHRKRGEKHGFMKVCMALWAIIAWSKHRYSFGCIAGVDGLVGLCRPP